MFNQRDALCNSCSPQISISSGSCNSIFPGTFRPTFLFPGMILIINVFLCSIDVLVRIFVLEICSFVKIFI